jgi:predicted RecA/RadA family phage recombinase
MATNRKFVSGRYLTLAVPSGTVSGGPVVKGQIAGVALVDRDSAGNASVDTGGVYMLSVKGVNDAGNVAIAAGDPIYFLVGDTPKLSAKNSGTLFGHALEVVNSGATTAIQVRLTQPRASGTAGLQNASVTAAKLALFQSTEQTGTGSAQNIAHGLGVIPGLILYYPTDLAPATAGVFTVVEGTHTTTNVVLTVTTGKKFKVVAIA